MPPGRMGRALRAARCRRECRSSPGGRRCRDAGRRAATPARRRAPSPGRRRPSRAGAARPRPASPGPRTAPPPGPPSATSPGSMTWSTSTWWPRWRRKRSALSARSRSSSRSETNTTSPRRRSWCTTRRSAGSAAVPWPASSAAQRREQLPPVAQARARRQHGPDVVVEGDEAGRVALAQQDQRERGDEPLRVGELRQHGVRAAGPGHRAAGVAHHHGAEVGLLLELLHVQAVVAAQDLPVHVAQLVARLIHPVLGELDGEPSAGRSVEAGQEAFDDPFGDDLEPAQLGDLEGVEQIEPGAVLDCSGAVHAGVNRRGVGRRRQSGRPSSEAP